MSEWNPRARQIFAHALLANDDQGRQQILDRECGGDARLRAEVSAMFAAHARASDHHANYSDDHSAIERTADYEETEASGVVIAGKYKLLQQIGKGGMGSVWMADQTEPVKRRVAIKLIRPE